ncbi:MAG: ribonuclease domain-containing protein [Lachnospiraceae bacterium]|nr:ribonuclease domain-containing protein [Lachnospiraceae bacterium]
MRCSKRAGRLLSCILLAILCALAGLLTACSADMQSFLSEADTEAVYEQEAWNQETEDTQEYSSDQDTGGHNESEDDSSVSQAQEDKNTVSEDGTYTSPDQVALYIHLYGHLPSNYITKKEAEAAGWNSSRGNLWDVAYGMSIGGSRFGNYEGALPDKDGRKWYECDVNYQGGYRGSERLLYSSDGLIYYTGDHYETFEQLY